MLVTLQIDGFGAWPRAHVIGISNRGVTFRPEKVSINASGNLGYAGIRSWQWLCETEYTVESEYEALYRLAGGDSGKGTE